MTEGLICACCGAVGCSEVRDSRPQQGGWRRRRVCACGHRFSTMEVIVEDTPMIVERVRGSSSTGFITRARPWVEVDLRRRIQAVLDDPAL